ncbi:hypothetical protein [Xanthomonas euvesicatoria]|uniref:hypothetical protein n=1 Tax=Xanthomonas euvesicatoria TaxID=456327 RepID=UPI001B7F8A38|nr:hypothetical protein [Xanthomonas euvesicatoria]
MAAMAFFRNLLQSNWSAMLRLTQSSLRKVNLEPLFIDLFAGKVSAMVAVTIIPHLAYEAGALSAHLI